MNPILRKERGKSPTDEGLLMLQIDLRTKCDINVRVSRVMESNYTICECLSVDSNVNGEVTAYDVNCMYCIYCAYVNQQDG